MNELAFRMAIAFATAAYPEKVKSQVPDGTVLPEHLQEMDVFSDLVSDAYAYYSNVEWNFDEISE